MICVAEDLLFNPPEMLAGAEVSCNKDVITFTDLCCFSSIDGKKQTMNIITTTAALKRIHHVQNVIRVIKVTYYVSIKELG